MPDTGCPHQSGAAPPAKAQNIPLDDNGLRPTPGPKELISSGSQVNPLEFLGRLIAQYGDVVRYQTRFGASFLFTHPAHVQAILHNENYRRASLVKMMLGNGLLTSDGPQWRSLRRLMQKDFLPAAVAPFACIITDETDRTASAWRTAAQKEEPVDVTKAMTRLTLRIVLASLFSDDLSDERSTRLCDAFTDTIMQMGNISSTIFGVPVNFTPTTNARFAAAKKIVDDTCYEMVARRRALTAADRPPDLLTLLLESDPDNGPMTDAQLRDEIVTMIVGGHETTALALAWAWKLLADHPEAEAALHKEIDQVLAGRTPKLTDVPKLAWTRAVFQEAMRLYPPVWYMARVANEADVIDGHAIPRGACVMVSAWFTHRHPQFWPDAERFDPARFTKATTPSDHRYAYFPFGGGRHQCIGMHFAMMEGTIILAQLAQQFRAQSADGRQINPDPGITLRQTPAFIARMQTRIPQLPLKGAA